ncbi:thioredoxin family protein, partial [Staphylococcus epidermidis]|uniref:thioredoxin family protein n=1 Tax=Staphylococcus epidermidis TaxID=1282 RepID=UPI00119E3EA3
MINIPILNHTIQFLNNIPRLFHTHHHTHLIHQYLTNRKSTPIPIFLFINHSFQQFTLSTPTPKNYKLFSIKLQLINCH